MKRHETEMGKPEQLQRVSSVSIGMIRCSLLWPALKKTLLVGNPQKSLAFQELPICDLWYCLNPTSLVACCDPSTLGTVLKIEALTYATSCFFEALLYISEMVPTNAKCSVTLCNFLTLPARLLEHLAPFCHFGVWQSGTTQKPWLQRPKATRKFYPKTLKLGELPHFLIPGTAWFGQQRIFLRLHNLKLANSGIHPSECIARATQQIQSTALRFDVIQKYQTFLRNQELRKQFR